MRVSTYAFAAILVTGSGQAAPPADSIEYALTDTKLKASLSLKLKACPPDVPHPQVEPELALTPVPVASALRHRVTGRQLTSFFQKRDVSITLNENGTLKAIGGGASDKTMGIITNVLKAAASFVIPLIPPVRVSDVPEPPPEPLECSDDAKAALAESARLAKSIAAFRKELLASSDTARIKALSESLEALAVQRSAVQEKLKLKAETDVIPPAEPGAVVFAEWRDSDFAKWFKKVPVGLAGQFVIPLRFDAVADGTTPLPLARSSEAAPKAPYLLIREPVAARVSVPQEGRGAYWAGAAFESFDPVIVPVGQWGGLSYYPLRAGLGRSRSLKLDFDALGRKTAMTINSEAAGEVITGGLATGTDTLMSVYKASTETARQQARINQLKVEQELRKLEACQEKLDAGLTC